jgi:hypothetical protein
MGNVAKYGAVGGLIVFGTTTSLFAKIGRHNQRRAVQTGDNTRSAVAPYDLRWQAQLATLLVTRSL